MVTVTISGPPGSGTTTVSKLLEEKIGVKHVYAGDIFRKRAKKYNMTLEEFGSYCEKNPEVDKELDEYQKEMLKKDDIILEGRIAGWLAHKSRVSALKVFLTADEDVRVKRIVNREQGNFEGRREEMRKREESEAKRYKEYYDIDVRDTSIYDVVIDTTDKKPEEITNIITSALSKKR